MRTFLMQDWTTIRGTGVGGSQAQIVQGEDKWLDFTPFQDCVFWIDCRAQSGASAPSMTIETAPSREDALFAALVPAFTLNPSPVVLLQAAFFSASVPVARWIRWKLTVPAGEGSWDATFRIWAGGVAPGA